MQSPSRTLPNKYPQKMNKREAGVLGKFAKQIASFMYDRSVDGGTTGLYASGILLPANAVVTNVYADEQTAFTSGGSATVQLKAGSTDLTGDLAFDTGFAGQTSLALASSATAIKVSAASELKVSVEGAALTAGKCRFAVEFYISE